MLMFKQVDSELGAAAQFTPMLIASNINALLPKAPSIPGMPTTVSTAATPWYATWWFKLVLAGGLGFLIYKTLKK